jgi:hypothetical protein
VGPTNHAQRRRAFSLETATREQLVRMILNQRKNIHNLEERIRKMLGAISQQSLRQITVPAPDRKHREWRP